MVLQPAVLIPGMARSLCCDVKKTVTPTSWVESCRKLHAEVFSLKNYMNIDIAVPKFSLPTWQKLCWVSLLSLLVSLSLSLWSTDCLYCNFAKGPIMQWGESQATAFPYKHMACLAR